MRSILYHMTSLLGTSHLLPGGGPGTFRGGGGGRIFKGSTGGVGVGSEIKNHRNGGRGEGEVIFYYHIIFYFF